MTSETSDPTAAHGSVKPSDEAFADAAGFVLANTVETKPPLVPEVRLRTATVITPIWHATEEALSESNLPPPFWAFAWAGGQALARYLLDVPSEVRGRSVLDLAAGGGLVSVAAALVRAKRVIANDIDRFAEAAIHVNASLNDVTVETVTRDLIGHPLTGIDVVVAGDIFYERPLARRAEQWLRSLVRSGKRVLIGDPGRTYMPATGVEPLACYAVPTPLELEDAAVRETTVWRLLG